MHQLQQRAGSTMCDTSETYAVLREGFLKFHQDDCNVILHLFTGALGVIGCCCLVYRFSNRSLGTLSILLALYASSLIGTVPLPLVIAVSVFLACVATPIVYAVNLGVVWSVVTVVIAYLGQDAAHYITGEPTFQSTYSGADSLASVANATTWINNFSEHTFFLLPLTVDAAVPLLPDLLKSRFGSDGQGGPAVTPSWLISVHENAWILAVLVIWVGGCYALDSDSGPFPFMFVKNRMLHCNLGTEGLRRDIAAIRKWATHLKPSRETTTHWWFSDLAQAESEAFTRVATCAEVSEIISSTWVAAICLYTFMHRVLLSARLLVFRRLSVHLYAVRKKLPSSCTYYSYIYGVKSSPSSFKSYLKTSTLYRIVCDHVQDGAKKVNDILYVSLGTTENSKLG